MAKVCLACGKTMGFLTGKVNLADGPVCVDCWKKAGFDSSVNTLMSASQYYSGTIKEIVEFKDRNQELLAIFAQTKKIGVLSFDDDAQIFMVRKSRKEQNLYYYNQIVDFELLEDGDQVTKGGLGRAVAGGLLFGGVGAVVGGVTGGKKTKGICKSLQIKITLRNSPYQTEYIQFIDTETKTKSFAYKAAYKDAQETLSALQLAVDMVKATVQEQSTQVISGADEILKYKNLLDAGIITEEEFNKKKAQILAL